MEPLHVKIGMFGENDSDKTSIILRYVSGENSEGYVPTSDEDFSKTIQIDDFPVNVTIIDAIDIDEFPEMRYSYYQQVQGFVIVFDISKPQSLDYIKNLMNDIKDSIDEDLICVVAANNCHYRDQNIPDLISIESYKEIENEFNCKVFETSTITGQNIDALYDHLVRKLFLSVHQPSKPPKQSPQSLPRVNSNPSICSSPKKEPFIVRKVSKNKEADKRLQKKIMKSVDQNVLINQLKFSVQQKCIQVNKAQTTIKRLQAQLDAANKKNEEFECLQKKFDEMCEKKNEEIECLQKKFDEMCEKKNEEFECLQKKFDEMCEKKNEEFECLQKKFDEMCEKKNEEIECLQKKFDEMCSEKDEQIEFQKKMVEEAKTSKSEEIECLKKKLDELNKAKIDEAEALQKKLEQFEQVFQMKAKMVEELKNKARTLNCLQDPNEPLKLDQDSNEVLNFEQNEASPEQSAQHETAAASEQLQNGAATEQSFNQESVNDAGAMQLGQENCELMNEQ